MKNLYKIQNLSPTILKKKSAPLSLKLYRKYLKYIDTTKNSKYIYDLLIDHIFLSRIEQN